MLIGYMYVYFKLAICAISVCLILGWPTLVLSPSNFNVALLRALCYIPIQKWLGIIARKSFLFLILDELSQNLE